METIPGHDIIQAKPSQQQRDKDSEHVVDQKVDAHLLIIVVKGTWTLLFDARDNAL